MSMTAGKTLAFHTERQQFFLRQRVSQQTIDGKQPAYGTSGTRPQTTPDRHMFDEFNLYSDFFRNAKIFQYHLYAGAYRIFICIDRQSSIISGYRTDTHSRRCYAIHNDLIPRIVYSETQYIKSTYHVRYSSRCKHPDGIQDFIKIYFFNCFILIHYYNL